MPMRKTNSSINGPTKTKANTPKGWRTIRPNTAAFQSSNADDSSNKFTRNMTGTMPKSTIT